MFMRLRKSGHLLAAIIVISSGFTLATAVGQERPPARGGSKEIAITIDDLPLNGPQIELKRLKSMTSKLVAGLNKFRVPAVGFVNESLLYRNGEADGRIQLLRDWRDAGVELG